MPTNWEAHKLHRHQVITDTGQWIGLIDENGEPITDLTTITELNAPETRNQPTSMTCTINLAGHTHHPAITELIANLGTQDPTGRLIPANTNTRMLAIERAGMPRRVFRITHVVATGGMNNPDTLQVHGVDELDVLASLPCPSMPSTWKTEAITADRDWAQMWKKPRRVAAIQMAQVADGFAVSGPAEQIIRETIRESLFALYRVAGITKDYPFMVSSYTSGRASPNVLIRPTDGSIWEELAPIAVAAGVRLSVRMWWPGDPPELGLELNLPTWVIRVEQIVEVNDA